MNKKAQEEWVYGIPAIVALIIFLAIFWVFFVAPQSFFQKIPFVKSEKEIYAVKNDVANIMLMDYLKTPLVVDGNKITMSDLISLAQIDNTYKQQLETETESILNSIKPHGTAGWNIEIRTLPEDSSFSSVKTYSVVGFFTVAEAKTTIPLYQKDKFASVRLYEDCQGELC